jgi:hypothetical protein
VAATLRDVAELAGVSISTASRAITPIALARLPRTPSCGYGRRRAPQLLVSDGGRRQTDQRAQTQTGKVGSFYGEHPISLRTRSGRRCSMVSTNSWRNMTTTSPSRSPCVR